MGYPIIQDFLTNNRPGIKFAPIGTVVHATAVPGATAKNIRDSFQNHPQRKASAHATIDWNEIRQMIPWNEKAWHACHTGNELYIGCELCQSAKHDPAKFQAIWNRAIWFYAYWLVNVLHTNVVTKDNLLSHAEVTARYHESDHTDPVEYFAEYGKTMDQFRAAVQAQINSILNPAAEKEELDIMAYDLQPIAKGMLNGTSTLTCCSKPSNNNKTASVLRKGKNEPIGIYAKCTNEGIDWYLVNTNTQQWVAAKYVQLV